MCCRDKHVCQLGWNQILDQVIFACHLFTQGTSTPTLSAACFIFRDTSGKDILERVPHDPAGRSFPGTSCESLQPRRRDPTPGPRSPLKQGESTRMASHLPPPRPGRRERAGLCKRCFRRRPQQPGHASHTDLAGPSHLAPDRAITWPQQCWPSGLAAPRA